MGRVLTSVLCILLSAMASGTVSASDPIRLDASSRQAAVDSFRAMLAELPQDKQEGLQMAVIKINLDGVGNAAEMLADPELRSPGVARIRDRVSGMTADEIIAEADTVTSVQMFRPDQ